MFATTRATIDKLDDWVNSLAAPMLPLVRKPGPGQSFFFRYAKDTAGGVIVAKAVRIASGLRAALILNDARHVTEAQSILRTVGDFCVEVLALGEGIASGKLTASQEKFVAQFYTDLPESPEDLAAREREFYVSRSELLKAQKRLFATTDIDVTEYERLKKFVEKHYDSYVHGGYDTAMELFHGGTQRFQTRGHASQHLLCLTMTSIAGKLFESLSALAFVAQLQGKGELAATIYLASSELMESREMHSDYCSELRGMSVPAV